MEKLAEAIKPILTKAAVKEASSYGEKTVVLNNAEYEVGEFGVRYDYSGCGDTVWQRLKEEAEAANKRLKEREEFLRAIKGHVSSADPDTGEILEIYSPVRTSTTSVQCKIK